ncbi:hypothetical protein BOX15_Mlig016577g1, partial [Macrostomum lignano]
QLGANGAMRIDCQLAVLLTGGTGCGGGPPPRARRALLSLCGRDGRYRLACQWGGSGCQAWPVSAANIERLHTRFLSEGRLTLCLTGPHVQLLISGAEPRQLAGLARLLGDVAGGRGVDRRLLLGSGLDYSSLTPLDKRRVRARTQTQLTVSSREAYPSAGDFPPHLVQLSVGPIGLRRFDARLCRLGQLSVLRIHGNQLESLPDAINRLPLTELSLPGNRLVTFPGFELRAAGPLASSLAVLDLRDNCLAWLGSELGRLAALRSLDLCGNRLTRLPDCLPAVPLLRSLALDGNRLRLLPRPAVRLDRLSIGSGQPFSCRDSGRLPVRLPVPDLASLCLAVVRRLVVDFRSKSPPPLPWHLLDDLAAMPACAACRRHCDPRVAPCPLPVHPRHLAACYELPAPDDSDGNGGVATVPVMLHFCSAACFERRLELCRYFSC